MNNYINLYNNSLLIIIVIRFIDNNSLQCNRTVSLDVLHHQLLNEPRKIAVIGSGCSVATEPTAEISHYYNIVQV